MPPTFRRFIHMSVAVPGLVLMDVRMPVMTGTKTVQQMRALPELLSVPVIAVTASSLLTEGMVRRNFSGYLRKPVSRVELHRQIAHFIPQWGTVPDRLPILAMEPPAPERASGWEQAAAKLRRMESSSWPALLKTLSITGAQSFAGRLQALADASDCPPLRGYAEELQGHADRFAADDMERHLAAFPQLIALLEECISQINLHAPE